MRDLVRTFAFAAGGGLAGGIGLSVIAHVSGQSVRPWLTCVLAVTVTLLATALVRSAQLIIDAQPVPPDRGEPVTLTDRKRGGLDATVRMIERATNDPDRFEMLRTRLVRLTDERLRTVHGIDVRTDPERARALVGDGLVELVSGRPSRRTARAELDEWMTRLETL